MTNGTTPARKPFGPPWRWVLIGSLCLNVALIGWVAGAALTRPEPPPPPGLWGYGRALPQPYQKNLAEALRATRGEWIGPREALRGQRVALADALIATPYDPVVVAEVITREPRLMDSLAQRGSQLLLDQIGRMTPEDRASFAEALRRQPDRGPDHGPDHGPGKGHPPPPGN